MQTKKGKYCMRPIPPLRAVPSWRAYQALFGGRKVKTKVSKRIYWLIAIPVIAVLFIYKGTGGDGLDTMLRRSGIASIQDVSSPKSYQISKAEVQKILAEKQLVNLTEKSFAATYAGQFVRVDTSIDMSLQRYLHKKLKRKTSRYIGIVIMDAATGRIKSMVGYDKTDPENNPCIDNRFPAASIFKIVTAAAAVETRGLQPTSTFSYNGRKYTLYKSQLKDRKTRYTNRITLRDSFAQSINPVFGKIGMRDLGKSNLEKYAVAFGFNRSIDFDIPITPSSVTVTDEPYQLAEIASGFNRETTLSALHGVLLAAAILNNGSLIVPTLVERVSDKNGHTIYHSQMTRMNQAISPEASKVVSILMQATVRSGTSRKAFRGYRKDRILSKLVIGGKTGSIFNKSREARFDWFVGFAKEKKGDEQLAVSVVVAHEEYIGTRASQYARMAIRHYFDNYFSHSKETVKKAQKSS